MTVKLHQPAAGKKPGETYTGPMEDWLLANGYASKADATEDFTNVVDTIEEKNPTAAENREAPEADAPVEILGEEVDPEDSANAPEVEGAELPPLRNLTIGADEAAEVTEANAEHQATVDPEDVEGFPSVLEEAVAAAQDAEQTGDHLHNEPTDEVAEPAVREQETDQPLTIKPPSKKKGTAQPAE